MANAYYGLGCVLVKENRQAEAVPYFTEALRINPGFQAAREQLRKIGR
jgi:tetratricopeptide (TPR) repeat protein